jgi:hypothetical protein
MQRRREQRYEIWESVVLTVLEPGQPGYVAATVVDISSSGYRVLSGTELAIGAEVLITLNSVAIVGRVRHCEPAEPDAFTAGVEITKVVSGVAKASTAA